MLIGGVVHDQLDHHLQTTIVRGIQEGTEVIDGSIHWVDVQIVGDVIAIVLEGGREEGQDPQTSYTQVLEIVHFLNQARKIADSVRVAVLECLNVELVDYRVLIPEGVRNASQPLGHLFPASSVDGRLVLVDDNSEGRERHAQREGLPVNGKRSGL